MSLRRAPENVRRSWCGLEGQTGAGHRGCVTLSVDIVLKDAVVQERLCLPITCVIGSGSGASRSL